MTINFIPNDKEKDMAFMLGNSLEFIGSLQFMNSNLENLVHDISTKE